jgi:penicillin-binding protein 2
LQDYVYGALEDIAFNKEYEGGAGVVMDIQTGELLTLTTYSQDGSFLNKATNGLFIPGSIIKPFIAMAALSEGVIDPEKEILSTGSISLTDRNGQKLFFNDWKPHGYVDMQKALGVSSNVYFYAIGGGYEDQVGLGIDKITEYLQMFGIGDATGIEILTESEGQTPTPEWKEDTFNGDEWRLADTYLTSIGQHGYEVTPLQMVRAVSAIATEGEMVTPTIIHSASRDSDTLVLPLEKEYFKIVKEGMKYAVVNRTASGLYMDEVTLAAKTGTAEVDIHKEHIHSWLIGYFPYDKPKYAFVFMLDTGPWGEETGAVSVAQNVFEWIRENRPEYTKTF